MERIQFYPNEQLKKLLEYDAKKNDCSVSTIVVNLLQEHYHITPTPVMNLDEAIPKVLGEVEDYIKEIKTGETFDLLSASTTFADIQMVVEGRPGTNRATIGKIFASKIGDYPFENVKFAYSSEGKILKSKNRAIMYIKT